MIEPDDSDEGEEWKRAGKADNPRNEMDFGSKIVVNSHTKVPFSVDDWKVSENENQRIDIFHKGTYISIVLGEKIYCEIFKTDCYEQILLPPEKVIELGDYFNKKS